MGQEKVEIDALFAILSNEEIAADKDLPETGVGLDLERKLSPLFIKMPDYGTRSSAVLLVDHDNHFTFAERTYENGLLMQEKIFKVPAT